ncbi:MAG TPA: S8 family serine peptidase, partial [Gaiellaceae bacterium]|nr:S8 family serine peptidase [Gaiellaceae bacterium]
ILKVEPRRHRRPAVEPALVPSAPAFEAPQWQWAATRADQVPEDVLRAAGAVTIAVVDTGADVTAPDLAAKRPVTYDVRTKAAAVVDRNGHGTFVASLAAGSATNGEGIAGAGGDARLMIVKAGRADGSFSDVDEAAAIVWAVDNGARVLNLSLGGPETSAVERRAIDYAVARGALLVAAVGNDFRRGNPIEYPAALLQPPGSYGAGGVGLAVTASTRTGERASFANTGSHVSLAAPGEAVFGAVASTSSPARYPRVPLPGSLAGLYGIGSGTSYAAPQVAGAAALVWAANPALRAADVATILEQTATGRGRWTPQTGFGVVDVAAAVAAARGLARPDAVAVAGTRRGNRVTLSWPHLPDAAGFRVSVARDGGSEQVLTPATRSTSVSYSLPPGSVYSFRVAALDSAGAPTLVSAAWTVSLRRAKASLALAASPQRGHAPQRVELAASLRVAGSSATLAGRSIVLESHDGERWTHAALGTTDASGRALWRFTLGAGAYEVRARFAGTDELGPATSNVVPIAVAPRR